jgi:putative hemolysin
MARSTGLTRFPVYGSRLDEVLGQVNIYDIVTANTDPEEPIKRFMRPGLYVPNTVAIDKLLFQMQRRKTPMAIVVDEFGGADGIVTVDDVVEEVIGAFESRPSEAEQPIQRQGEDMWVLDGHVPLDRLNEELGLDLPKKNYETLAGFLMTEMEKIPEEGDRFKFANLVFTVSKAKRHTIQKVQLRIKR